MNGIKEAFAHLRIGAGKATLAASVSDSGEVRVGIAFCSPRDQYNRKKGRAIAAGRRDAFGARHTALAFGFMRDETKKLSDELTERFNRYLWIASDRLPRWLKDDEPQAVPMRVAREQIRGGA